MMEPTVWMQLGITEERHRVVLAGIQSIVKTKETIGNMMLMVQGSTKLSENEKLYAAFMVSKYDIQRKLAAKLPPFAHGILGGLTDD
jgi:hypothetical protein